MKQDLRTRIRIVRLKDPIEYRRTEEVQRKAWGMDENEHVIPSHLMIAVQHHGGLVLGAYHGGKMVGCLFGIPAVSDWTGETYHYSHITGVVPSYQKLGVGFRLKQAQRRHLLDKNCTLVRWTYDPLQAKNAYFNIRKLGAVCNTYHRNFYGPMQDGLNRGMVSDRFQVDWHLASKRVEDSMNNRLRPEAPILTTLAGTMTNETRVFDGVRCPTRLNLDLENDKIGFEIPSDISRVKERNLLLARKWTSHVRACFENYFRKDYTVTDVLADRNENRVFYLLKRGFRLV